VSTRVSIVARWNTMYLQSNDFARGDDGLHGETATGL